RSFTRTIATEEKHENQNPRLLRRLVIGVRSSGLLPGPQTPLLLIEFVKAPATLPACRAGIPQTSWSIHGRGRRAGLETLLAIHRAIFRCGKAIHRARACRAYFSIPPNACAADPIYAAKSRRNETPPRAGHWP